MRWWSMGGVGDGSGRVVSLVARRGLGEQELEGNRGSEGGVRAERGLRLGGVDGGRGRLLVVETDRETQRERETLREKEKARGAGVVASGAKGGSGDDDSGRWGAGWWRFGMGWREGGREK